MIDAGVALVVAVIVAPYAVALFRWYEAKYPDPQDGGRR